MERTYELMPRVEQSQKSFYGKAIVKELASGSKVLMSYDTAIMMQMQDGTFLKLWDDWSATTGKHIYAFSGMRKKEWDQLEIVEVKL